MMRATQQLGETSEVFVVVSAMAISVEVSKGTVKAVVSEAASKKIHEEVSEVLALEKVTEAASEVPTEEDSEVVVRGGYQHGRGGYDRDSLNRKRSNKFDINNELHN